jgi:ribosomal protein L23
MSIARIAPHLTEKSVREAKEGRYTFLLSGQLSSGQVAEMVKRLYNVNPTKVSLVKNAPKLKGIARAQRIRKSRLKAIVVLKKGEKIADFVVEEKK